MPLSVYLMPSVRPLMSGYDVALAECGWKDASDRCWLNICRLIPGWVGARGWRHLHA